ncbi:MAG: response regulator transcription factor [Myxococcota bacterium]
MSNDAVKRSARILLVEDDARLRELLRIYLSERDFDVDEVDNGELALRRVRDRRYDVVLLDVMLPGLDGFRVCRAIRDDFDGGIVLLTARRADADQVSGLDLGADDYVTKPVDPQVLIARLRSLMRRLGRAPSSESNGEPQRVGSLELDSRRRRVTVSGQALTLTEAEFEVLSVLVERQGEVVSRDLLSVAVRGVPYDGLDRSIDIHISRIRRKLRSRGVSGTLIRSIRGSGYLVAEDDA